jgi:hypothetical protein
MVCSMQHHFGTVTLQTSGGAGDYSGWHIHHTLEWPTSPIRFPAQPTRLGSRSRAQDSPTPALPNQGSRFTTHRLVQRPPDPCAGLCQGDHGLGQSRPARPTGGRSPFGVVEPLWSDSDERPWAGARRPTTHSLGVQSGAPAASATPARRWKPQ